MSPVETSVTGVVVLRLRSSWQARLAGLAVLGGAATLAVWVLTAPGYFWPRWVWLGLATPFAVVGTLRWAWRRRTQRSLAMQAGLSGLVVAVCLSVWLLAGAGYPWPLWSLLGVGVLLGVRVVASPPQAGERERELAARVGMLAESRRDVLETREAELHRIERDLHDGAQARLVSLGMSLGLAEELFDGDPAQARRYLADARTSAGVALADLRGLVRGIRPPVLADRGLRGAVRALVVTLPLQVELTVDGSDRTRPDPVDTAVYFAVAEALANVVKHSGARKAWVRIEDTGEALVAVVGDDGQGGADPRRGSGLVGIERRLAAFDGTVGVVSPIGGGTVVRVEVPCEPSSPKTSLS